MVSQQKVEALKAAAKQLQEYPVVGVVDMHKMPARQLNEMRTKLAGKAVIRMVKKRLMSRALADRKLQALEPYIRGEPALFLTKENPFAIARILQASTSEAPAKPGDIAPRDIVVKAGPTSLSPGPVIGELQKAKIAAGVEGEKIVIKKDTVVVKQGQVIERPVADILTKLGIQPMEIGLNLIAVWEKGVVYGKDILFIPPEHHLAQVREASSRAFALSIQINYLSVETVPLLLGKAHREAEALSLAANIASPATAAGLLAKAHAEAQALEKK